MTLKNKSFILTLLLIVLGLAVPVLAQEPAATSSPGTSTAPPVADLGNSSFVPGEILVKFKPGLKSQGANNGLARVGGRAVEKVPAIDVTRVEVPQGRELAAAAALQTSGDVAFAEPNYIAYALDTPSDPYFSSQWAYDVAEFSSAWDITKGNSDVVVAVIDTGIDLDHPDLNCMVSDGATKITSGFDFYNGDDNPDDDNGHGTHVAGTVAGCTDNGLGVSGAAPNVRLMPIKVLGSGGSGSYADVADGIIYAANNGAKIINLSLGGSSGSDTILNAVEYAYNKGVLIVAASGNANTSIYYPAAYSQVMAVGSTDSGDTRSSFSNYGAGLDVVAPGEFINSTMRGGGYGYLSGTSMASPHVAGLAALVWSAEPGLTHNGVRQIIRDTADDLGSVGYDNFFGYGRINAWSALEKYATIDVHYASGGTVTGPITFFVDDVGIASNSTTIRVSKASQETITWNASLSPDQSWIALTSGGTGITAAAAYGDYTLAVTRPAAHGTYTTNLVITGQTASGTQVGPEVVAIKLVYVSEIQTLYFPTIVK
ncbi:MAG: peptidase S8 [Anaerolineae bacterium]|nr:peptidase S8 [Anaerolineae bacterium]MCB9104519.1 peptidase S8 [Anaerolineales bacterium]